MMAIFDWSPKILVVFLCPNPHALWHEMNRLGSAFLSEVMGEFEKHERDRLVELAEMRDRVRTNVWPSVRQKCEARSSRGRSTRKTLRSTPSFTKQVIRSNPEKTAGTLSRPGSVELLSCPSYCSALTTSLGWATLMLTIDSSSATSS